MSEFQRSVKASDVSGVRINEAPYDRTVKLLASPSINRRSTNFAVGISIIEQGKEHEVHVHDSEETIFVLSGHGLITINGEERVPLEPETVIVLRGGEPHGLTNTGNEALRVLWVYAPTGPESKFVEK